MIIQAESAPEPAPEPSAPSSVEAVEEGKDLMQISDDGKELQVFPPEALTFSPIAEEVSASATAVGAIIINYLRFFPPKPFFWTWFPS